MVTMQDPFRPNSNAQLMREAQIGFLVVGLLLCVLVYVAFYRLTNRSSRFDEIARNVAVAEPVDSDPYQAHSFGQIEEKLTERFAKKKKGPFAAIDEFSSKMNSSKLQQPSPDKDVAQATHMSSFAEPKKPTFTRPKTSSRTKPRSTATGFVPVAKPIPTVPGPTESPSVRTDLDVAKETISRKLPNKQPKVAPPVLTSKFGSLRNKDFAPAPNSKKVKTETDPAGFEASPRLPSKENSNPASHIGPKPQPPVPDSIDVALPRQLPARSVEKILSTEAKPQRLASQKQLDSKKIDSKKMDLKQPDRSSFVAQTSAFAPTKLAPVPARASSPKHGKPPAKLGKTYATKKGDSLWTIAQAVYGDGRYFRALHEQNLDRLSLSEAIPTGTLLVVPAIEELQRDYPELCPEQKKDRRAQDESGAAHTNQPLEDSLDERFYRTEDSDTLFEIARQRLGQASRYLEIYELNRFRIPETANHLTPLGGGIELLLPQ